MLATPHDSLLLAASIVQELRSAGRGGGHLSVAAFSCSVVRSVILPDRHGVGGGHGDGHEGSAGEKGLLHRSFSVEIYYYKLTVLLELLYHLNLRPEIKKGGKTFDSIFDHNL